MTMSITDAFATSTGVIVTVVGDLEALAAGQMRTANWTTAQTEPTARLARRRPLAS
jgi:hypothetical protein